LITWALAFLEAGFLLLRGSLGDFVPTVAIFVFRYRIGHRFGIRSLGREKAIFRESAHYGFNVDARTVLQKTCVGLDASNGILSHFSRFQKYNFPEIDR
jgi:hypothetical protein